MCVCVSDCPNPKTRITQFWRQNIALHFIWPCLALSGLSGLYEAEALGSAILGFEEDLLKDSQLKQAGVLTTFMNYMAEPPSGQEFAVALYCCMAADIMLRKVTPASHQQILNDVKKMNGFLTGTLKLQKKQIPANLNNVLEKFHKEREIELDCFKIGEV